MTATPAKTPLELELIAALKELERKANLYAQNSNAQKRGAYIDLAGIAGAALAKADAP